MTGLGTILLAVLVASTPVDLMLDSNVGVRIGYTHEAESDARDRGKAIAEFIWKDFCQKGRYKPCNSGNYYSVDISLAPGYCVASIEGGQANSIGIENRSPYLERGEYRCREDGSVYAESYV